MKISYLHKNLIRHELPDTFFHVLDLSCKKRNTCKYSDAITVNKCYNEKSHYYD